MKLIKAMATVAGLTGLSRIAGFVRDILTAAFLGAGPLADAFFVALKLPNFFRRVTAEGAFSVSFVPVYSEVLTQKGAEAADRFAANTLSFMLVSLSVFVLLAMMAMPWVIYGVAPGFSGDPLRYDMAVELSRITFPYLLFMSLTALLGGVLNARDRFAPFAFAPVIFNLCLIAALLLSQWGGNVAEIMAWGIVFSGVLQLAWLWVNARRNDVRITVHWPQMSSETKRVLRLMGPGVIGAGVMHINLFADLILASFLESGAISYLYYADRLNQLPLGMVGIAVGTALLPMLSRALSTDDENQSRDLFNRAMELCLLLALPAAAALLVMPHILIETLFERGAFTAEATTQTAAVLMAYALGLPAYVAIKVFSTAHWARQDTATPVKIAVVATVLNILLSIVLIQFMGAAGIALATSLAGWLQFFMHRRVLRSERFTKPDGQFRYALPRIIFSTCIMSGFVFFLGLGLGYLNNESVFLQILALLALVLSGVVLYGVLLVVSDAIQLQKIRTYFKRTQT